MITPEIATVNSPIGIFDSGFGGLTVARAIADLMPNEDLIYVGDTARAPYGPKSIAEVRKYALECLDRINNHGVKCLVIACNSASSAVLHDARERYDVPIFEVITPAARAAINTTKNGKIGVLCTQATATSKAYNDALAVSSVEVHTQVCHKFVEFVEGGYTSGAQVVETAKQYLQPLKDQEVDTVILGCTHYPLLSGVISHVLGDSVQLVSSSDACARDTYNGLTKMGLLHDEPRKTKRLFYTTGDPELFSGLGQRLVGALVKNVRHAQIGQR